MWRNTRVIGWIYIFTSLRVEPDPFTKTGGIVVFHEHREEGICKALIKEVQKRAKEIRNLLKSKYFSPRLHRRRDNISK